MTLITKHSQNTPSQQLGWDIRYRIPHMLDDLSAVQTTINTAERGENSHGKVLSLEGEVRLARIVADIRDRIETLMGVAALLASGEATTTALYCKPFVPSSTQPF